MNSNLFLYNEKLYAEHIISTGELGKHKTRELRILGKYYKYIGMSIVEIKDKIIEFCNDNVSGFDMDIDFRMINNIINYTKKNTSKLLIIESVPITDEELNFVNSVDLSYDHKKVLLGLIIHNKINKEIATNAYSIDSWKNYFGSNSREYQVLRNNCGIKNNAVMMSIMHDLYINGFTENRVGKKPRLKFINEIKDGNVIYELKVINNFSLLYEKLNGNNKITECTICGELIRRKLRSMDKYCSACAKEKRLESHGRYNKKRN